MLRVSAAGPASQGRPASACRSPPQGGRCLSSGKRQLHRRTARTSRTASRPKSAHSLVLEEPPLAQTLVEVLDNGESLAGQRGCCALWALQVP